MGLTSTSAILPVNTSQFPLMGDGSILKLVDDQGSVNYCSHGRAQSTPKNEQGVS